VRIGYLVNAKQPIWKLLGETPAVYAIEDGFDRETSITRVRPVAMTRDQLLGHSVLTHRGQELTVRGLIRYVAHTAGGVQFGPPSDDRQRAVQEVARAMAVGGYPSGSKTLLAVGRVVAKGLEPLVARIEQDQRRSWSFVLGLDLLEPQGSQVATPPCQEHVPWRFAE
jgi:hypothetical protein